MVKYRDNKEELPIHQKSPSNVRMVITTFNSFNGKVAVQYSLKWCTLFFPTNLVVVTFYISMQVMVFWYCPSAWGAVWWHCTVVAWRNDTPAHLKPILLENNGRNRW